MSPAEWKDAAKVIMGDPQGAALQRQDGRRSRLDRKESIPNRDRISNPERDGDRARLLIRVGCGRLRRWHVHRHHGGNLKNDKNDKGNKMKKLLILVCMAVTLSLTANADITCWEEARRYWIRAPAKEKQFEEYVVFYVMDHAFRFFNCQTEMCAKVREQNDNDVMNYINWHLNDSFMIHQYYTMEEHFEDELSTLDFRHWKKNNEHWKEGYNWQEFRFQANHCPMLA